MTLQTVADRVGVSRMTVSNAFSRPDQLSDELRRKILAVADELGYAGPDPAGRALARGRTGVVGMLLMDSLEYAFTDPFATDLMAAIAAELEPSGVALTLLMSHPQGDSIPARDVPLDGAMVFSCSEPSTSVEWLRRRKLPMVLIDQDPSDDATCINIDERGGATAAAEHLYELGHRKIGIITAYIDEPPGLMAPESLGGGKYATRERTLGYIDYLASKGITATVVNAVASDQSAGVTAGEVLLEVDPDERPTALLCYSDTLAFGVLRTARRLKIDVPDQLSIVGFDDIRLASTSTPPLTTVHQDIAAKGHAVAAALTELIEQKGRGDTSPPRQIMLPTHLVVRESTAPPA